MTVVTLRPDVTFSGERHPTREELDRLLVACDEVRSETGFAQWPSTRRRRNEEVRADTALAEVELA